MGVKPFQTVLCKGTHRQMGRQQGEWMRPRLDTLFHSLVNNQMAPRWARYLSPAIIRGLLSLRGTIVYERHISHIDRAANAQMQRLHGIAEGAEISLYSLLGISSIETMAAHMQFVLGCTSLAVAPERSKSRRPLLAYNHDFPSFLRDHMMIRQSHPREGLSSVQLTYPAIPGCICGVNEAGVAMTLNHAFTTEPFNNGVPPTFMMQEALDNCHSVDEVIAHFADVVFSCGSMVTVMDETGDICVMELSRERFGVRGPKAGIALTLNDYQLETLQEIEVPANAKFNPKKYPAVFHGYHVHQHNWERRKRFHQLIKNIDRWSVADLKRCLSDHDKTTGSIGTICRHHGTVDTIATAILNPIARTIEAGRGHPCQADYQSFGIT